MPLAQIALPLFVPATRMDRFSKACASGADAVIVDLEDAVATEAKNEARAGLERALPATNALPVLVRINASDTPYFNDDIAACRRLPITGLVLPKAEDPDICARLSDQTGLPVIGLIETARGLFYAHAVAARCARLAFGSIDFAADLGLAHKREPLLYARAQIVLASRLSDLPPPWDGVTVDVSDAEAVLRDCKHSVDMGFGGKLIIHPAQIPAARRGFAPSAEDREWAQRVVNASSPSSAAITLDGQMIDAPVVKRAQQILARAGS